MLAAFVLALAFALAAGYWAAVSPAARRLILPALDVLQAVPILGFFPAAVFFFIRLFRGSAAGVEAAAVFLVFTSQAWNLAFSVYESVSTILYRPEEGARLFPCSIDGTPVSSPGLTSGLRPPKRRLPERGPVRRERPTSSYEKSRSRYDVSWAARDAGPSPKNASRG
jgi:hypothetical protein